MKTKMIAAMMVTMVALLTFPVYAIGDGSLNFSGDWSSNQTLSAPGVNNGVKFDGEKPSDFSSRTEYEDYMYNKYGKTEKKKLDPNKYSRLLQTENGEVYDFRQSEAKEKEIFLEYRLPILESLVDVQTKADALADAVNRYH